MSKNYASSSTSSPQVAIMKLHYGFGFVPDCLEFELSPSTGQDIMQEIEALKSVSLTSSYETLLQRHLLTEFVDQRLMAKEKLKPYLKSLSKVDILSISEFYKHVLTTVRFKSKKPQGIVDHVNHAYFWNPQTLGIQNTQVWPISCKNLILGQNGQNFWPNFGLKKEFYYAKGPS